MLIDATNVRLEELRRLQAQASGVELDDDQAFVGLVVACRMVLELTDQQFADGIGVSRPTVNRWSRGANLPHRLMRGPIAQWIEDRVEDHIRARSRSPSYRAIA